MTETRFWLVRHALVEENARAMLYGTMDVELCPHTLAAQGPMYAAPRPAPAASGQMAGDAAVAHPPHRRGDLSRRLSAPPNSTSSPA